MATTSKPRLFSKRRIDFCTAKHLPNYAAKLCYNRCIKYKIMGKCKDKYKVTDVYDLTDPKVHDDFVAANFKVLVE